MILFLSLYTHARPTAAVSQVRVMKELASYDERTSPLPTGVTRLTGGPLLCVILRVQYLLGRLHPALSVPGF
jgi:hypothetical protein